MEKKFLRIPKRQISDGLLLMKHLVKRSHKLKIGVAVREDIYRD